MTYYYYVYLVELSYYSLYLLICIFFYFYELKPYLLRGLAQFISQNDRTKTPNEKTKDNRRNERTNEDRTENLLIFLDVHFILREKKWSETWIQNKITGIQSGPYILRIIFRCNTMIINTNERCNDKLWIPWEKKKCLSASRSLHIYTYTNNFWKLKLQCS